MSLRTPVKFKLVLTALCLSALSSACSESSSGVGAGAQPTPTNPEEAIKALPAEHQAKLETWKASLQKTCNASEAVGLASVSAGSGPETSLFLDMRSVAAANGGALWFADGVGSKNFAILGSITTPVGEFNSEAKSTTTVSGATPVQIEATASMSGGLCRLYLYGQLVYETSLASKVQIAASFQDGLQPNSTATKRPRVLATGGSDEAALQEHGYVDAISNALTPNQAAVALIARKLNFTADVAARYFVPNDRFFGVMTIETKEIAGVLPFSEHHSTILGSKSSLLALSNSQQPVALRIRFLPLFGGAPNAANFGATSAPTLDVTVKSQALTGDATAYTYQAISASWAGSTAFNDADAISCARNRLRNLRVTEVLRIGTGDPFDLGPTYDQVHSVCLNMSPKIFDLAYSDLNLRTDISNHLNGGSVPVLRHGWSELTDSWIRKALADGTDLNTALNPSNNTGRMAMAAAGAKEMITSTDRYPILQPKRIDFAQMGANWALNNEFVGKTRKNLIVDAAANVVDVVPTSLHSVLSSVKYAPSEETEVLNFAVGLRDEDKARVRQAISLGISVGLAEIEATIMARFLQNRTTTAEVEAWITSINAAKDFSTRDLARVTANSFNSHEKRKFNLIFTSVIENWTAADFIIAEAIAPLLQEFAMCSAGSQKYTDVSQLIGCEKTSLFSKAEGKLIDRAFGDRYALLARSLIPLLPRYSNNDWMKKQHIVNSFFDPLWKSCTNELFAQRSQQLTTLIDDYLRETDWIRANEKSRAIDELMRARCY